VVLTKEKTLHPPAAVMGGLFHDHSGGNSPKKKPCIRLRRVREDYFMITLEVTAQGKIPASAFGVCRVFLFLHFAFKLRLMLCSK
jgi:hypothetical protein